MMTLVSAQDTDSSGNAVIIGDGTDNVVDGVRVPWIMIPKLGLIIFR